jgi:large subunit ribosomal protein L3
MGNERSTTQNLAIVDVRPEENLLYIKGAIPGPRNGVVMIRRGVKVS